MANKRVFYACEAVQLRPREFNETTRTYDPQYGANDNAGWLTPLGVQSVGMTSNFNLEKIFTLGQLAQYDSVENNPEVEVTVNKVFDGTATLYQLCMGGQKWEQGGSLMELANNRVDMRFSIYRDTSELTVQSSGVSYMESTGMFMQSVSFTFPTDGNATEDVTLISSNKKWYAAPSTTAIGVEKTAPSIVRRWKFDLGSCVLPTGDGGMRPGSPLNSVTISTDLNREPVYTLGSYEAYDRSIQFPVEVTCEIESLAIDGDFIDLSELQYQNCTGSNIGTNQSLASFPIKFVICGREAGNNVTIDLGNKNKLNSISYGGGEAGGGNLTITYSFTTDNTLSVTANGTYSSVGGCVRNPQTGNLNCS